jgi:hypothetical protein
MFSKTTIYLLILLCCLNITFAKDDFEIKDFNIDDIETFEKLELLKTRHHNKTQQSLQKSQLESLILDTNISTREQIYITIKKNTPIFSLDEKHILTLPQMIIAKATRYQKDPQFLYLVSKKDIITYKVRATDATNIVADTNISEIPNKFISYKPIKKRNTIDQSLTLSSGLNLQLEMINSDLVAYYDNQAFEIRTVKSYRYELFSYIKSNLPFDFGMLLNFQNAQVDYLSDNSGSWTAIHFGPILRTSLFKISGKSFNLLLSTQKSLFNKLALPDPYSANINFSSYILQIGLEFPIKTNWGDISLSTHYKKQWLEYKTDNSDINLNQPNSTANIFAVTIGFELGLIL